MSGFLGRALIAALSLTAGSWVGLGTPSVETARAVGREHLATHLVPLTPAATPPAPESQTPASVDPSLLPDTTAWPQLNPTQSTTRAWLLAEGPAHPNDARRLVTLTFDDGPFPETTPTILRLLARRHIRATFFFIGRYLDGNSDRAIATREVAHQVADAGHIIGNHTHDHECLTIVSKAEELAQIDEGAASIERTLGVRPVFFRPPYGQLDPWGSEVLRQRKNEMVMWNVEVGDMLRDDSDAMADSLKQQLDYAGGGIVLLHDIRPTTIPALDKLLRKLDEQRWDPAKPTVPGYQVVDLVEYLRATAASPQPFADRTELEHARGEAWRKNRKTHAPIVDVERSSESRDLNM